MLRFEDVSKKFGRCSVLLGVHLAVEPGEAVFVTGGNGSGKSTLLRLAAGLARPSSGVVTCTASRVYVPATVVMPRRTPLRVVLNGLGAMTGTRAPLEEALEAFGCGGHLDRSADTLSTGTVLKALIGQALTSAADLVVLDEPAAHLDEDATSALVRLIEQARRRGTAVLAAGAGAPLPGSAVARLAEGHLTPVGAGR